MNLLEPLRAFLAKRSVTAYLVGGVVRDILLGRETHDLDLAVSGDASRLARGFADEIGAAYFQMDETFDVARVIFEFKGQREIIDLARLRGSSIREDLGTRDFTINAMAADAATWNGEADAVIDPFNGREDVGARRIRAISDGVFRQDAVRLMRALRMEAELDFVMTEGTAEWVRRDASLIENAPMERVRDELVKIIGADDVLRNLRRLDEADLLGRVLPELDAMRGVTQSPPHIYEVFDHSLHAAAEAEKTERAGYMNLAQGAFGAQLREHFARRTAGERTRRELLRLALLLHDIGKPSTRTVETTGRIRFLGHDKVGVEMAELALRRLKFSNDEIALVKVIIAHHLRPLLLAQNGISDRAVYRYFRDTGGAGVDIAVHAWCDQHATYGADAETDETIALQAVIGRLLDRYYHMRETVVSPPSLMDGDEVMRFLKLPPGPRIGKALEALREAQATGEVTSREEAFAFLSHLPGG